MTYYEYLLPNTNQGLRMLKRAFLLLACFNFLTGAVLIVVAAIINWRFVFAPIVWFLLGFVYGNIAYIFVTDYKYVYDNGTFCIYKHRKYGKYHLVASMPIAEIEWDDVAAGRQKQCTNCPSNVRFVWQNIRYVITVDDYMLSLIKGETNVS